MLPPLRWSVPRNSCLCLLRKFLKPLSIAVLPGPTLVVVVIYVHGDTSCNCRFTSDKINGWAVWPVSDMSMFVLCHACFSGLSVICQCLCCVMHVSLVVLFTLVVGQCLARCIDCRNQDFVPQCHQGSIWVHTDIYIYVDTEILVYRPM